MPSTKSYLDYILDKLAGVAEISTRAMMGEYILYYRGTVVGGVYDDSLLLKPTPTAKALLPEAPLTLPYPGAKPMLLVTETDDGALLKSLIAAVWQDLPKGKK